MCAMHLNIVNAYTAVFATATATANIELPSSILLASL